MRMLGTVRRAMLGHTLVCWDGLGEIIVDNEHLELEAPPWHASTANVLRLLRWLDQSAKVDVPTIFELLEHPKDYSELWERMLIEESEETARANAAIPEVREP